MTVLFEACNLLWKRVKNEFLPVTMASTSKAFKRCVHPCPRYLTPDDTHNLCVFCLGEEHARDVLEGAICVHCECFSMRKLRSRLSLFSRKEGQPSASRGSRPTVAEARRGMSSWGSQAELADELERGLSFLRSSAANEGELLDDDDAISLTSSSIQRLVLCLVMPRKSREILRGEEAEAEPRSILLPCVWRVTGGYGTRHGELDLPWKRAKMVARGVVSMSVYLSGHSPPAQWAYPFLLQISIRRL